MCATSLKITYVIKDCTHIQQNPRKEHQETSLETALCQSAKLFITSSYLTWSKIQMSSQAFNPGNYMWIPPPPHYSPPKHTSPWIRSLKVTGVAFGMMILLGLKSPTLHLVFEPGRFSATFVKFLYITKFISDPPYLRFYSVAHSHSCKYIWWTVVVAESSELRTWYVVCLWNGNSYYPSY